MGKYDKQTPVRGAKAPWGGYGETAADLQSNPEFQNIALWLNSVKFKKKAVGGLDPDDVWKKIEELNSLYENALVAERVRCNMMIALARRNGVREQEAQDESDG